jgi:hypothetical protein
VKTPGSLSTVHQSMADMVFRKSFGGRVLAFSLRVKFQLTLTLKLK